MKDAFSLNKAWIKNNYLLSIHSEFKPKHNSTIDEKMFQCTGQGGI